MGAPSTPLGTGLHSSDCECEDCWPLVFPAARDAAYDRALAELSEDMPALAGRIGRIAERIEGRR